MKWLKENKKIELTNQQEIWKWSVEQLEDFWRCIWDYCEIDSKTPYKQVLDSRKMPGAKWFEGATLNYSEHVFKNYKKNKSAMTFQSETLPKTEISWDELQEKTGSVAQYLREIGVRPGNRVVGYMPNIPETIVAL